MSHKKTTRLKVAITVAAATIGSGAFAIPYVIQQSGWSVSVGYFIALIAIVSLAHILYFRTIEVVHEKERLLGLARKYFSATGFWIGFFSVVFGLLLSFVAYLALGTQFIRVIIPGMPPWAALFVFWLIITVLVFNSEGNVSGLEIVGVALISCAILFIFILGNPFHALANTPLANPKNFFLPFGAALFSLAGWTCVEQVYEITKEAGKKINVFILFVIGTTLAGILYWLFALGVLGTVAHVSIDTISGSVGWPFWKKDILAVIGLLAMGIVSIPLSREIRGALEKDLRWNSFVSRLIIVGLPLIVILSGFNNFLVIVSFAGGIFISAQYLLIIAVGSRALQLSRHEKALLDVLAAIFICAIIYEITTFIVH